MRLSSAVIVGLDEVMVPTGTGGVFMCKKATQGRTTRPVRARFMGR